MFDLSIQRAQRSCAALKEKVLSRRAGAVFAIFVLPQIAQAPALSLSSLQIPALTAPARHRPFILRRTRHHHHLHYARITEEIFGYTTETYTYLFEGRATQNGRPCADARVVVQAASPYTTITRTATTRADGTYHLAVALVGSPEDTVDWVLDARSPDAGAVQLMGRRIILDNNDPVTTVQQPLRLAGPAPETDRFQLQPS